MQDADAGVRGVRPGRPDDVRRGGASLTTADVFLPVPTQCWRASSRETDVPRGDAQQAFRQRVAQPARPAFDAGVAALSSGDSAKAEGSFKSALGTDAENTAVLAYLGAVFASAGRDDQAAGAWQTALIDGSDLPQIYEWLAEALMRQRRVAEARGVLEEAVAKWPSDERFSKPLAMAYATFGQGQRRCVCWRATGDPSDRCRGASARRRVVVSPEAGQHRCPDTRRRPCAGAHVRRGLREGEGPAACAGQAVDGVSRRKVETRN